MSFYWSSTIFTIIALLLGVASIIAFTLIMIVVVRKVRSKD